MIFTSDKDGDRRDQLCKCFKCGIISKCTPSFDFYTVEAFKTDALYCERCFGDIVKDMGIIFINEVDIGIEDEDCNNN